jgi:hypothetical protein
LTLSTSTIGSAKKATRTKLVLKIAGSAGGGAPHKCAYRRHSVRAAADFVALVRTPQDIEPSKAPTLATQWRPAPATACLAIALRRPLARLKRDRRYPPDKLSPKTSGSRDPLETQSTDKPKGPALSDLKPKGKVPLDAL